MVIEMIFETERLVLRPWTENYAESLYKYASDDRVGPAAGWPVHVSVEDSRRVIKEVLSAEGTYAVVLKETNETVGSVGLMKAAAANFEIGENDAELGYWIGVPYWGRGLIPEAAKELIRYAFETENMDTLWCGYYDGNDKSKRVQEKCGFTYHHTNENIYCSMIDEIKTEHISRLTKEDWERMQRGLRDE